jgi:hypothetical protein
MKTWLIPISLSISLPLLGGTARADQCAWVEPAAAVKAQAILTDAPKYLEFCEPCGDKAPGIPQRATSVNITTPQGDYRELSVNGTPIDLAYVFVKTSDTQYQNLALLAGCPASGVSPSLAIAAETTNGVLITADDYKPAVPVEQATAITSIPAYAPPAPPAPPPAPHVYVYTTMSREVSWLALALAAGGGAITGSALTLLVLAARRRRDMRPRAMDFTARAE